MKKIAIDPLSLILRYKSLHPWSMHHQYILLIMVFKGCRIISNNGYWLCWKTLSPIRHLGDPSLRWPTTSRYSNLSIYLSVIYWIPENSKIIFFLLHSTLILSSKGKKLFLHLLYSTIYYIAKFPGETPPHPRYMSLYCTLTPPWTNFC